MRRSTHMLFIRISRFEVPCGFEITLETSAALRGRNLWTLDSYQVTCPTCLSHPTVRANRR